MHDENKSKEIDRKEEELQAITAAPDFIEYEGKSYPLSPLDIETMAILRKWAKTVIVEETRENITLLGDGCTEEMSKSIWALTYSQLRDPLTSDAMETPEAVSHWAYLSLKVKTPDLTVEKAKNIVNEVSLKQMLNSLMTLNGVSKDQLADPTIALELLKRRARIGQGSLSPSQNDFIGPPTK